MRKLLIIITLMGWCATGSQAQRGRKVEHKLE